MSDDKKKGDGMGPAAVAAIDFGSKLIGGLLAGDGGAKEKLALARKVATENTVDRDRRYDEDIIDRNADARSRAYTNPLKARLLAAMGTGAGVDMSDAGLPDLSQYRAPKQYDPRIAERAATDWDRRRQEVADRVDAQYGKHSAESRAYMDRWAQEQAASGNARPEPYNGGVAAPGMQAKEQALAKQQFRQEQVRQAFDKATGGRNDAETSARFRDQYAAADTATRKALYNRLVPEGSRV